MKVINSVDLYLDLLLDLGLSYGEDFTVNPWDSPSVAAKKLLAASFLKKFKDDADANKANKAATDNFLSCNDACGSWQLKCETFLDTVLVQTFQGFVTEFFVRKNGDSIADHHYDILNVARNGPGASIDVGGQDSYTKLFSSTLSHTTAGLYACYADYVKQNPIWHEAETIRQRAFGADVVVAGNRLSFVPKNAEISRVINIEPPLNMFFQLGIGGLITERLRSFFSIDLSSQPDVNRALAARGSLDNSLVTIDLKDASGLIAYNMVKRFVDSHTFAWLDMTRSPSCQLPDGSLVSLQMLSTMGNGYTFPLQTALFCCVVAACFAVRGMERLNNRAHDKYGFAVPCNWGVFGDDIIVPRDLYPTVLRLLSLLGFRVNSDKTHVNGPFRESCGFDAFKGVNVRGVYVKTLRTPQDRYTAINLLNAWSARHGITLCRTVKHLMSGLRRMPIPPWENGDGGIWIPERGLRLTGTYLSRRFGSRIYSVYRPNPKHLRIVSDSILVPRGFKPRLYNEPGLWLAFLAGTVFSRERRKTTKDELGYYTQPLSDVQYVIPLRPRRLYYTPKEACAPSWDHSPTAPNPFKGSAGGSASEEAVLANIASAW